MTSTLEELKAKLYKDFDNITEKADGCAYNTAEKAVAAELRKAEGAIAKAIIALEQGPTANETAELVRLLAEVVLEQAGTKPAAKKAPVAKLQ